MFVDDSGKRRRLARLVGTSVGGLALVYVTFVGLTFAGAPGLGGLDAAGLGQLTNPAGDETDVGSNPVEQAAPEEVADEPAGPAVVADATVPEASSPATTAGGSAVTAPPAPTTTVPATTTTTTHGHGTATPNSTVPDKGGGPPTSRPNG